VTSGTKVTLADGSIVKARELSGQDDLLFLRDSVHGSVIVRHRRGSKVELNSALHAN
jgi:2,3,4,5-tetrahydropyridine-2-carboxylate N-succinyltransferase